MRLILSADINQVLTKAERISLLEVVDTSRMSTYMAVGIVELLQTNFSVMLSGV